MTTFIYKSDIVRDNMRRILEAMTEYGDVFYFHDDSQLCIHFWVVLKDGEGYEFDASMNDLLDRGLSTFIIYHHSKILDDMKKEGRYYAQ